MELDDALSQIAEIRRQVARVRLFRGYRAVPVAFSGVLALLAGGVQARWLPDAARRPAAFLALWIGVAAVSIVVTAGEMAWRLTRSSSLLAREKTLLAVGQFLPCLAAGGLVTLVLAVRAPDCLWLLPGLWQVLFGLGIFASWRLLPRGVLGVAVFYMATGLCCLARGEAALAPWAMAVPFGVGQLLAAGVLWWSLERSHEHA